MEIKNRIKEKADELYRRYGVKSVTMDEIASQLGVSKKTIYQSFSDKNQLVEEVVADMLNDNKNTCRFGIVEAGNAIHELFLVMEGVKEMLANLNPSFVFDIQRGHPRAYKKFVNYKNDFILKTLIANIQRGKEEGLYRPEMNTDIISRFRLETMMLPFNEEVFPRTHYAVLELQTELVEYFLYGMVTLKGYELIKQYKKTAQ